MAYVWRIKVNDEDVNNFVDVDIFIFWLWGAMRILKSCLRRLER